MSNIPVIVVPCIWLILNREYTRTISKDMLANSLSMILACLCSAYFHATLSFAGQLLDEWVILWATMTAIALWIPKSYFPTCCDGSRYFKISSKCYTKLMLKMGSLSNDLTILIKTPIDLVLLHAVISFETKVRNVILQILTMFLL